MGKDGARSERDAIIDRERRLAAAARGWTNQMLQEAAVFRWKADPLRAKAAARNGIDSSSADPEGWNELARP